MWAHRCSHVLPLISLPGLWPKLPSLWAHKSWSHHPLFQLKTLSSSIQPLSLVKKSRLSSGPTRLPRGGENQWKVWMNEDELGWMRMVGRCIKQIKTMYCLRILNWFSFADLNLFFRFCWEKYRRLRTLWRNIHQHGESFLSLVLDLQCSRKQEKKEKVKELTEFSRWLKAYPVNTGRYTISLKHCIYLSVMMFSIRGFASILPAQQMSILYWGFWYFDFRRLTRLWNVQFKHLDVNQEPLRKFAFCREFQCTHCFFRVSTCVAVTRWHSGSGRMFKHISILRTILDS